MERKVYKYDPDDVVVTSSKSVGNMFHKSEMFVFVLDEMRQGNVKVRISQPIRDSFSRESSDFMDE